jgi:single-stranded DNA-binding protein
LTDRSQRDSPEARQGKASEQQFVAIPVVVVGRLQQRSWTAEDGSARSVVEVVAEELGPSLRWATSTTTRTTRSQ